jgi:CheY-like chemotaxis protein
VALLRERGAEIDVALVDLSMPGLGGPETVRALHALRPALPVVLTSGYSEAEARDRVGVDRVAFLQKPFEVEDLVARISGALG